MAARCNVMRKELTFMEAVDMGNNTYVADNKDQLIINGHDLRIVEHNQNICSIPIRVCDLKRKWYIDEPEKTLYKILRSQSNEQIPLTENMKHDYKRIIDRGEQAIINALRAEHDIGMQRATYYFKEHLKKFIEFFGNDDIYNAEINIIKGEAKKIFGEELL